jgi:4-hydroxy-tetrahydrodipicolinate reductase
MSSINLAIHGAAGRMGQRLVALAHEDPELTVTSALEYREHPRLGTDAGVVAGVGDIGVPLTAKFRKRPDVVIDFSLPEAVDSILEKCVELEVPMVVATTGLSDQQQAQLREAAKKIPICWAPNMSLAVNLVMKLSEITGAALRGHGSGVDVEIIERHHRYKEDAPSGTALKFGEIIAEQMGQSAHVHGREGRTGARPQNEIAYHALRVGDDPGQHTIVFGMLGETIELRVAATSRDSYAHGALAAAKFIAGKDPGLYSMNDVLGL